MPDRFHFQCYLYQLHGLYQINDRHPIVNYCRSCLCHDRSKYRRREHDGNGTVTFFIIRPFSPDLCYYRGASRQFLFIFFHYMENVSAFNCCLQAVRNSYGRSYNVKAQHCTFYSFEVRLVPRSHLRVGRYIERLTLNSVVDPEYPDRAVMTKRGFRIVTHPFCSCSGSQRQLQFCFTTERCRQYRIRFPLPIASKGG